MKRGPYAKTGAKREEILDAALRMVARDGYSRTTVRELADEVGSSPMGILHHFGSKEALLAEVVRRRDVLDSADSEGGSLLERADIDLVSGLPALVRHNAEVPGLVQLYTRVSAEASEADHRAHEYFRERYERVRAEYARAVQREQDAGRLSRAIAADTLALVLVAAIDGLQSQWLYDASVDMEEAVAQLLKALTRDD